MEPKNENTTVYINAEDMLRPVYKPSTITLNSSAFTASAATFNPSTIATTNYNPWEQLIEDKLKEYCYSTDKHLDDLEEDIDFLDKRRKEMNNTIDYHSDMIGQFQSDISLLVDENARLRANLNDLQGQIYMLQQKLDNQ